MTLVKQNILDQIQGEMQTLHQINPNLTIIFTNTEVRVFIKDLRSSYRLSISQSATLNQIIAAAIKKEEEINSTPL